MDGAPGRFLGVEQADRLIVNERKDRRSLVMQNLVRAATSMPSTPIRIVHARQIGQAKLASSSGRFATSSLDKDQKFVSSSIRASWVDTSRATASTPAMSFERISAFSPSATSTSTGVDRLGRCRRCSRRSGRRRRAVAGSRSSPTPTGEPVGLIGSGQAVAHDDGQGVMKRVVLGDTDRVHRGVGGWWVVDAVPGPWAGRLGPGQRHPSRCRAVWPYGRDRHLAAGLSATSRSEAVPSPIRPPTPPIGPPRRRPAPPRDGRTGPGPGVKRRRRLRRFRRCTFADAWRRGGWCRPAEGAGCRLIGPTGPL